MIQEAEAAPVTEASVNVDDIPLADADPVKEEDIAVKVADDVKAAAASSPEKPEPAVTVTVQSKTITKEAKDGELEKMEIPSSGEPLDPESIISNIKSKTTSSDITVTSHSKVTTVVKKVDESGKETVNIQTKETTYLPSADDESKADVQTTSSSKTYTFESPQTEIQKEEGGHVLVTSGDQKEPISSPGSKDEMALFGALKMLRDTADGLDNKDGVVQESIHTSSHSSQSYVVHSVKTSSVSDGPNVAVQEEMVSKESTTESSAMNGHEEPMAATGSPAKAASPGTVP